MATELEDNALLNQAFSRANQSDWMKSLKRVARAQAILWHGTEMSVRLEMLSRVDQEEASRKTKGEQ
jgi:hypothetical protein